MFQRESVLFRSYLSSLCRGAIYCALAPACTLFSTWRLFSLGGTAILVYPDGGRGCALLEPVAQAEFIPTWSGACAHSAHTTPPPQTRRVACFGRNRHFLQLRPSSTSLPTCSSKSFQRCFFIFGSDRWTVIWPKWL